MQKLEENWDFLDVSDERENEILEKRKLERKTFLKNLSRKPAFVDLICLKCWVV